MVCTSYMKEARHELAQRKAEEKRIFSRALGERIRDARLKKGMSQEELAHESGFYRTYVGHIETATYSPSTYTVWRLARSLGVDLRDLLNDL